ncbi:hypothetical protein A2U01_0076138, partial [Trifolium medium]|nr:hypothetical protein [Trifolium medium]
LIICLHLPILLGDDDLPVHHFSQHTHTFGGEIQARVNDLNLGQRILPAMLSRLENALTKLLDPFNELCSSGHPPNRLRFALSGSHSRLQLVKLFL